MSVLSSLLIAAPETRAAAAKPIISATGTNCLNILKVMNNNIIITNTFTASAFSKLINIAVASFLLRCAILAAKKAPIITATPPANADKPALRPDITNAAIATSAVAIICNRNILLKILAVVSTKTLLSNAQYSKSFVLQKQLPAFEMGFSKVRDFELIRAFSQA